jgi:hypothetical protein
MEKHCTMEWEIEMPLKLEEMRGLLMQALRKSGWSQITDLEIAVGDLKAKTQGVPQQQYGFMADGRGHLERGESSLIHELVWSFIIQGILVPGTNDSNQLWPFLRLTEYGRRCVDENQILPHDPDGYLKDFERAIPSADPVIREYLSEALQCFLRDLNRAAAVMLGAASERAVLLLIESYAHSIADLNKKTSVESQVEKAPSIFRKYEIFDKGFAGVKPKLPKVLAENTDSLLRGVFDLIRNSRNEAGHPASGIVVSRDTNYSHLRLFIPYCQRIYELIDWFNANPT